MLLGVEAMDRVVPSKQQSLAAKSLSLDFSAAKAIGVFLALGHRCWIKDKHGIQGLSSRTSVETEKSFSPMAMKGENRCQDRRA